LSAWLLDFDGQTMESRAMASEAVQRMGPSAVPFLVERLRFSNVDLRKMSRFELWRLSVVEWVNSHVGARITATRRSDPRRLALAGLDALGPAGKDALPALARLLGDNPPDPRAVYVGARMGPAGLAFVSSALTNGERAVRLQARICLELVRTNAALMGLEAGSFESRCTRMNHLVLAAALEENRAGRPEGLPVGDDAQTLKR
jgi:hypothetical protein